MKKTDEKLTNESAQGALTSETWAEAVARKQKSHIGEKGAARLAFRSIFARPAQPKKGRKQ